MSLLRKSFSFLASDRHLVYTVANQNGRFILLETGQ